MTPEFSIILHIDQRNVKMQLRIPATIVSVVLYRSHIDHHCTKLLTQLAELVTPPNFLRSLDTFMHAQSRKLEILETPSDIMERKKCFYILSDLYQVTAN